MLQLAKLLHSRGFHITFVHTESGRRSVLRSQGPGALDGLPDFRYEAIPDGVVLPGSRSQQQVSRSCLASFDATCAAPFREMLTRLDSSREGAPRVTCVVYNWLMSFALDVAGELGIPALAFCTMSAGGFLGSYHLEELIRKGYTPLKDEASLTNGYLDTTIDWIPGMTGIRLRDLSSFVRTTDGDDFFLKEETECTKKCDRAQGLILNTFDRLEHDVTDAIRSILPNNVYTLGPLPALANRVAAGGPCASMRFSCWKQDDGLHGVARRAEPGLGGLRQLREPHDAHRRAADRVRVGPRGQRPAPSCGSSGRTWLPATTMQGLYCLRTSSGRPRGGAS
ncbi:7-deoxyloganetin glucosyltransferase-like [Iris pallida]|uniref:7-deoxyloganetin glucosyltransferase-like n=1 Tax=Iris pallida TaxID=29817 RepID=A0AAX6FHG1_IRIPA|nr:7-deoxyloganetin glucosyltransferase-like [Iris pallida]